MHVLKTGEASLAQNSELGRTLEVGVGHTFWDKVRFYIEFLYLQQLIPRVVSLQHIILSLLRFNRKAILGTLGSGIKCVFTSRF